MVSGSSEGRLKPPPPPAAAVVRGCRPGAGAYIRSHFGTILAPLPTVCSELTHECDVEMLKLSSDVNECKPLPECSCSCSGACSSRGGGAGADGG